MSRSPSSRMVVMTSAAFLPSLSMPTRHDGVARPGVIEKGGQSRSLLARRCPRERVGVDPLWVHPGSDEGIKLLIEGLMAGAHSGIAELHPSNGYGR